jgi:hypothetical protein
MFRNFWRENEGEAGTCRRGICRAETLAGVLLELGLLGSLPAGFISELESKSKAGGQECPPHTGLKTNHHRLQLQSDVPNFFYPLLDLIFQG